MSQQESRLNRAMRTQFPIPMRGNEDDDLTDDEKETVRVSDPHEG